MAHLHPHRGVEHEAKPGEVYCHQNTYIAQIGMLVLSSLSDLDDEALVDAPTHEQFSSLLGQVAWTVLTRADLAVYIQALQRRGSGPRVVDCRRLNLVVRYLKRHRIGLKYTHQGRGEIVRFEIVRILR